MGRSAFVAVVALLLAVVGAAPAVVGAQGAERVTGQQVVPESVPTPTTSDATTPEPSVPGTGQPGAPGATVPDEVPGGSLPLPLAPIDPVADSFGTPEDRAAYEAVDGSGDARSGHYADQPPFDPIRYNAVLEEQAAAARRDVGGARRALDAATATRAEAESALAEADARLAALGGERTTAADAAAAAQRDFEDRVVDAYIRGGEEDTAALMGSASAGEWLVAGELAAVVLDGDEAAARELDRTRAALDDEAEAVAEQAARSRQAVSAARDAEALSALVLADAEATLAVWEVGSHVAVRGFVFPVAGEVQFIDSFGAPRNVGTGYAHWHEGTDVMAANGTPVVAVEAGVIERAKVNTLGGNSLRLRGQSGHGYYYAHLSTYALGITEGVVVAPGQVLGYVGDTGDAKGGAPHVHFEIHRPPNDEPVNPYPILLMAWQAREDVVGLRGVRRPSPAAAPAGSAFGVVPPPGDPVVAGLPGGTPPGTVPPLLLRPPG